MNENIGIIVQGPIIYHNDIINIYENIKDNVIISTTSEDLTELIEKGFAVKKNILAFFPGRANFNNQVINTFEGIKLAKEKNFSHIFKIRSDIFINDFTKLLNQLKLDTIYFPAYHNYDEGYLCDHMMFGPIDYMLKLWDIPISFSELSPEAQLTKKFYDIRNDIDIDFLFPILYRENIKAYWKKYDIFLNQYEYDELFTYDKK